MPQFYKLILLLSLVCSWASEANSLQAAESTPPAGKKYQLAYKFRRGEVIRYSVSHSANIRTTIEGTTQEAETSSDSIKAWKVTDVLPNGEMEFVHLVEVVRMSNHVPNRALTEFDSERDKTPPPEFERAARAVGVPLSVIRISPSGKIIAREEKHPQPPVSEDLPITLQLPETAVAVGEQWDQAYDVPTDQKDGSKVNVRTRRVCTLESVKNGIASISVEYQILTPVSPFVESNLVDRITKGTVRFDLARGRIVGQQYDVDRRILGFHGDSSLLHHVSRLEERLLKPSERLAKRP